MVKCACAEPQLSTLHSSQSVGGRSVSQQRRQFARMGTTMIELKRAADPSPDPRRRSRQSGHPAAGRRAQRRRLGVAAGNFDPRARDFAGVERDFPRHGQHQRMRTHEQRPIIEMSPAAGIAHGPPKTWPATICNAIAAAHVPAPGARFSFLCLSSHKFPRLRPCAGYSAHPMRRK